MKKRTQKTKLIKEKVNSLEKYQQIDRHLVRLTRRKKTRKTQILKSGMKERKSLPTLQK